MVAPAPTSESVSGPSIETLETILDVTYTWGYQDSRAKLRELYDKATRAQWQSDVVLPWHLQPDLEQPMGPEELMPQVVDRLRTLLDSVRPPVLGIGLSLPGTLDPVLGLSIGSPVMSGWDGVELAPYFAELGDAPLFVANDADVLARAFTSLDAAEIAIRMRGRIDD